MQIQINDKTLHVVAGTRITVELILEKRSVGETIEQILEAHPRLTRECVLAAPKARELHAIGQRCAKVLVPGPVVVGHQDMLYNGKDYQDDH